MLEEGLPLLSEVHFSTTCIEQGHGSTATIQRHHRKYGQDMVAMRVMLHMCRPLVSNQEAAIELELVGLGRAL